MSELIFCCPQCLAIRSSGAIIDEQSARRFPRLNINIFCEECNYRSDIPLMNFLFTESFSNQKFSALV